MKYKLSKQQFGLAVRENRLKMKLTQEKLANTLSMSVNMISDIERGIRLPGRDKLFELVGYLNVSIDNFIQGNNKMTTAYDEISTMFIRLSSKQQKYILGVLKCMIELMFE